MTVSTEDTSGYVGNLTPSQEEKLRVFWNIVMQSWDPSLQGSGDSINSTGASNTPKKSHRRFFSLSRSQCSPTEEETSAIPSNLLSSLKSLGAEANDLKTIQSLLAKFQGDSIRAACMSMLKQDHPDALLLRFIRAEKWDILKAWIKLVTALDWRVNEFKVDEEVLSKGEAYWLEKSQLTDSSAERSDGEGFMKQLWTGKGHLHGCDKFGRPIIVARVRTHEPGTQTTKALNDYIIHCIELVRMLHVPPVETIELAPVKFIIDGFQEYYPETLGAMVFFNAPWIFSGFWKIISGLLDPAVAAKVHFINDAKALEQLIPQEHIIKELGGQEDWEWEYIEPQPHENDRIHDTATRDTILAERKTLSDTFFRVTAEWLSNPPSEDVIDRRDSVIKQLRENYWRLDPYVRSRSMEDRLGVIKEGGLIDFYPPVAPVQAKDEEKAISQQMGGISVGTVTA
ncbi:uncharacterized protein N7459_000283 [Penicillium hispanicum]|uniref:uncharacterized protein n=1 Tax=Penicillium hispanicum TaxID=1080232 RepID=UPI00253FD254|nr:uncharacterized protein N7459_000283 [Penicillium hispanicum]KAJ5594075.1 hypothetical protein N7459_000283 [Penicillium hispanicum]